MFIHFAHTISHFGYLGIFLLLAAENIGIPLPTEIAYVIAQSILIREGLHLYLGISLLLLFGHLTGAMISYAVGRKMSGSIHHNPQLKSTQDKLVVWYTKYGVFAIIATRMVGYVRPWSSYVAGIAQYPFWPFFWATVLGTLLFNILTLAATTTIVNLWRHHPRLHVFFILFAVFSTAYFLWHFALSLRNPSAKKPV